MTSTRPYLLRAMYEWMLDNGLTPQILVDAASDDVQVPRQHVEDGRIVLNIAPSAVRDLDLGNERVEFMARFGGKPFRVTLAVASVLAIIARENGAGMSFAPDSPRDNGPPTPDDAGPRRPQLKIVK